ncbi:acid ceramidase-like protein [Tieghemostelium lacteum]|uniref:Acid ceramidase-like protein n=1 Tax=Tieghemostelium lacteum TaxID=361077 RepID=A0A152AAA8_TIELA|nr:acid ceramidase-like protein [Tieghemostelium lacteum]|eukprot:KYR03163.1 acid ceramidase-like protein [Tieghemostelium lacteum]
MENEVEWHPSSEGSTSSSEDPKHNCKGSVNSNIIWNETPEFVTQVDNGLLYKVGSQNTTVNLLHVYGTPYQMGYAHGQLLKEQMNVMYPQFLSYAEEAIGKNLPAFINILPDFIIKMIEDFGVNFALDYIALVTKPYTAAEFYEELKGLSDGSGLDYQMIIRLHMFPELVKAHCSILGAWGEATPNGGLIQLRALDWGLDNPLVSVPTFIVYHPEAGNGHVFSILSWSGYIGALTGYSQRVGVSQKVWIKYNGTYSYEGIPFYFNLRNMLQYDTSIDEVLNRIYNTQRTCSIFLGVGSNESSQAVVVEYSHDVVRVFDDDTPFPGYAPQSPEHPFFNDIVYVDKHTQPNSDPCMPSLISEYYGQINAQALINLVAQFQTGDLHAAIYDFEANTVYISVASTFQPSLWPLPNPKSITAAYENQWIQLDMNTLFSTSNPGL